MPPGAISMTIIASLQATQTEGTLSNRDVLCSNGCNGLSYSMIVFNYFEITEIALNCIIST